MEVDKQVNGKTFLKSQIFFLILLFLVALSLFGQESAQDNTGDDVTTLFEWNQKRLDLQKRGMYVLGSWALANFAVNGIGMARSQIRNKTYYF
jgi:hypothetical protein